MNDQSPLKISGNFAYLHLAEWLAGSLTASEEGGWTSTQTENLEALLWEVDRLKTQLVDVMPAIVEVNPKGGLIVKHRFDGTVVQLSYADQIQVTIMHPSISLDATVQP